MKRLEVRISDDLAARVEVERARLGQSWTVFVTRAIEKALPGATPNEPQAQAAPPESPAKPRRSLTGRPVGPIPKRSS